MEVRYCLFLLIECFLNSLLESNIKAKIKINQKRLLKGISQKHFQREFSNLRRGTKKDDKPKKFSFKVLLILIFIVLSSKKSILRFS